MNKCTDIEIREMLPDLLHRTLDASARKRVEAHVASCEECTEDLEVLRTVKAAAVFAPTIDVTRVVGRIAPYAPITPAVAEAPARSRVVSWLVAASFFVVLAGGGSLLVVQQKDSPSGYVGARHPQKTAVIPAPIKKPATGGATEVPTVNAPHALALASGVETLSDNDLRQLMTDMNSFDALPASEPEPVMNVDNGDTSDQGMR